MLLVNIRLTASEIDHPCSLSTRSMQFILGLASKKDSTTMQLWVMCQHYCVISYRRFYHLFVGWRSNRYNMNPFFRFTNTYVFKKFKKINQATLSQSVFASKAHLWGRLIPLFEKYERKGLSCHAGSNESNSFELRWESERVLVLP